MTVSKCKRAGAFVKDIVSVNVFARFVGNRFGLAITAVEVVVFDNRLAIQFRHFARTDSNRFAAVTSEFWSVTEMVVVNPVLFDRVADPHDECRAAVLFATEIAMVNSIVGAVDRQPTRFAAWFDIRCLLKHAVRQPAMICVALTMCS